MPHPDAALAQRLFDNMLALTDAGILVSGEGWIERGPSLAWSWSGLPLAFLNQVVPCGPDVAPSLLQRAVAELRATGDPFSARVRVGVDDHLVGELERLGLRDAPEESLPGMALEVIDPLTLRGATPPDRLEIRRVEDAAGLAEHHLVMSEGFEMEIEHVRRLVPAGALTLRPFTILVGVLDGTAVATGSGWTAGDTVGVYNVATRPGYRRSGFGAALTRAVLLDGLARGASLAVLESTELGSRVYEAIGFREVGRCRVFVAA